MANNITTSMAGEQEQKYKDRPIYTSYTKQDFPIGQICHYSDRSNTRNILLKVTQHSTTAEMITLKSFDGYFEFRLSCNSSGLHPLNHTELRTLLGAHKA